ncbi:MAG TPA: hypothetical protein PLW97_05820 [Synergistaceae bacterium]|nr:hypothetical protein [Synergistaceae bacterium]HPQ37148.1 hypothetical protein [Synergistaceae bacterium]
MKKLIILLLGGLFLLGCGALLCAGAVPVVPDMPGWDREIPQGENLAQFTLPGEQGGVLAGFFVSLLDYATEEEAKQFEESLRNAPMGEGNIKVLDVKEDTYKGRKWVVHHLLVEVPGEEGDAPEVYEAQKFFHRERAEVYSFEFITSPNLFQELQPRFLECMERISFQENAPEEAVIPKETEEDEFVEKLGGKDKLASKKSPALSGTKEKLPLPPLPSQPPQALLSAPIQGTPSPAVQAPPVVSPVTGGATGTGIPSAFGAMAPPAAPSPAPPAGYLLELVPGTEWTANTPQDPSVSAYYLLVQQGINMAEMLVFEEDFDVPSTLDSYARLILGQAPQLFANYQVCQNWDTSINGVSVKVHEFFFAAQGNPNRLIGRAYIFMGGPKRGYVVLFDTTDQSYPRLAPKFDEVMRTLNLRPDTPLFSPQQPSQPLPGTGTGTGGLPSFESQAPDSGVYLDSSKGLRVPLPSGSRLTEQLPQGGRYALPDEAELVLLSLASPQEVESLVSQVASGKSFQGESLLQAKGIQGSVGLYASMHPQTSVPYATLVARYPQASLLMILTLPRENYSRAGSWILPFLESVSSGGNSGY